MTELPPPDGQAWPPPQTPPPQGPPPQAPPPQMPAPNAPPMPPGPVPAWPPADATIVVSNVSKSFGPLVAVSDVTFAVQPGVTALLGPNGAGKSTLIRLICGLTEPSQGTVWVAGGSPRSDRQARGRIGVVPQQDGMFERETALEMVTLAATLSRLPQPEERARTALASVELDPEMPRPIAAFSKGMRQRVKIAQAIVHDPQVIMLDEPLNGLDPRQRRQMIELFQNLGDVGKTVLVSSHVLDEVERFGSRVLVVAKGRLAAQGDFHEIRDLMDGQPLRVRLRCERPREVAAALMRSGTISGCTIVAADQLELTTADVRSLRRSVASVCRDNDSRLFEVAPLDDDLESVFRYLVGARS